MYNEIIETEILKRLQDKFCVMAGIYAMCLDHEGNVLAPMSGEQTDRERLLSVVSKEQLYSLYSRVAESSLEEQAVEDTENEAVKYAAVCIKDQDRPVITWLVCAVLSDQDSEEDRDFALGFARRTTLQRFNLALDLLRETSQQIVCNKVSVKSAWAENRHSQYSREETEAVLRRMEATTEMVQMLDSDAPVEEIIMTVLGIVGRFLRIDNAYLCRVEQEDSDTMDVVAEWCADGVLSSFDQTRNQPRPAYLYRDKPLVISSSSGREEYEADMKKAGFTALAAMYVAMKDKASIYACFGVKGHNRNWDLAEIKFLNDSVKVLQNILMKRVWQNSLEGFYAALEEVLNNVGSSIYVRDRQSGRILFVNRSLRDEFQEELEQDSLADIFESGIPKGQDSGILDVYRESRCCWYDLFYKNVTWVDGSKVLMCSIYDVTEKKMYQHKIERQAYTDSLTGLSNRMCCEKDLARYIDTARTKGREGAVLYMDLDDFKHINDSLGHQYGDILLKSIAQGIQNIPGISSLCYRMGGDEFVIIVPPEKIKSLDQIVKNIRAVFDKPWILKEADYYCTMSMGVVHFPSEGEEVEDLIRKADIAMYEAKKNGKNRVAVYSDTIRFDSNKRLDMEKNMREAAANDCQEFEVYYQPIIDIQEHNKCTGAEALIRWNSEKLGFMSPVDFIPLAEYLGLINPIGSHVLKEACRACKAWNDHGYPEYKINVNLSVVQLLQADVVDVIAQTVKESGINPRNLTLEVTEGLAIHDLERMKQILARIKEIGVRIALDDFGTGYSSLSHIRELPFDVIKVDQSFVKDLAEDVYSKSFIRMVSNLADAIGVSICVEGIETKEQYKVLEGMKVRMIQGYYFDKPMPQEEFEKKYVK